MLRPFVCSTALKRAANPVAHHGSAELAYSGLFSRAFDVDCGRTSAGYTLSVFPANPPPSRAYQMHSPFNVDTLQIPTGNRLNIRAARVLCLRDLYPVMPRHHFHRQCRGGGNTSGPPDLSSWSSATAFLALPALFVYRMYRELGYCLRSVCVVAWSFIYLI